MEVEELRCKWILAQSYPLQSSVRQFWTAVNIYTQRSHLVNRRLTGEQILGMVNLKNDDEFITLKNFLSTVENYEDIASFKGLTTEKHQTDEFNIHLKQKIAVIKKIIPKLGMTKQSLEVVVKDYSMDRVSFINIPSESNVIPNYCYGFSYKNDELNFWLEKGADRSASSYHWLSSKLVPKLIRWMESEISEQANTVHSLRLVSVGDYSTLYNKLRDTYGKQIIKMWPEVTDPIKFVYEDIGIATYLLLLWAGKTRQRFVDLGCGNGLLVHILNSEGHDGVGYDLRARKIWSMYPATTKLEVRAIIPSSATLFPEADWLIGNHSDELTVWIPVMAARSSYNCNFFLLPCCPYEFNGKKYNRTNTSVSPYSDFLNYVETVCKECRINTEKDKLRIPSTKRTCFVGTHRTYPESALRDNLKDLDLYIESKCGNEVTNGVWCQQFKPRVEEKVRNCSKIESDVRESIVNLVIEQLLSKRRLTETGWDYGGPVELGAVVKVIPSETLKKLKNECGGLQTLLKNHHHIFKVQSGNVQFRVPFEKSRSKCDSWKTKPCWFFHNHPNSCPLPDETCSFSH